MSKKIFLIGTCRTRVFGSKQIHNRYNQLWLDLVENELLNPPSNNVSAYVIEICSLKYNNKKLNRLDFISLIKKFNKLVPEGVPILWVSHINPILSKTHKKILESYGVGITKCNRIQSRTNIEDWLAEAIKHDSRSILFNPASALNGFNSSTVFKYRETLDNTMQGEETIERSQFKTNTDANIDTQHYADEGSEHVKKIHNKLRSLVDKLIDNN